MLPGPRVNSYQISCWSRDRCSWWNFCSHCYVCQSGSYSSGLRIQLPSLKLWKMSFTFQTMCEPLVFDSFWKCNFPYESLVGWLVHSILTISIVIISAAPRLRIFAIKVDELAVVYVNQQTNLQENPPNSHSKCTRLPISINMNQVVFQSDPPKFNNWNLNMVALQVTKWDLLVLGIKLCEIFKVCIVWRRFIYSTAGFPWCIQRLPGKHSWFNSELVY